MADTCLRHPAQPCGECPWRLDQPVGRFGPERYELLRNTSATVDGGSAGLGAPLFACHKSLEGREIACAGWLAVEGHDHVGVRLAVVTGRLDGEALHPGDDWPELYPSFDAMAEANGAGQPWAAPHVPRTCESCGRGEDPWRYWLTATECHPCSVARRRKEGTL